MATPEFRFAATTLDVGKFTVVQFTGREAMSELFRFEITVKLASTDVATFDSNVMSEPVTFTMDHDGVVKTYSGVVAEKQSLSTLDTVTESFKRLVMVPALWQGTRTLRSQVYSSDETVDAIVTAEVTEITTANTDAAIRQESFISTYPGRPFTCQYKESNYNFLARLMEHYGIYYFFEFTGSAMTLVIADDNQYPDLSAVATALSGNTLNVVTPPPGGDAYFANLHRLDSTQSAIPTRVDVQQFDPEQPSSVIYATAGTGNTQTIFLSSENPVSQADADLLAQVRLEELQAYETVWDGDSGVCLLAPGYRFTPGVTGATPDLLITEVHHSGENLDAAVGSGTAATYSNRFWCVDATRQYRPRRNTPRPVVSNIETGTVFAEQNDPTLAEIDPQGRYRVEFNFLPGTESVDGSSTEAQKAAVSHWLRMAQPAAGTEDGIFVPLKPGVEVTIGFVAGNPDLPIITGAVANAMFPPLVTAENANHALIGTSGLLALRSSGGFHKSVKTETDTVRGGDADLYFTGPTGPLDEATEMNGEYVVDRRYGEQYEYFNGHSHFYSFGPQYEEFHANPGVISGNAVASTEVWPDTANNPDAIPAMGPRDVPTAQTVFIEKTWGDEFEYRKGTLYTWSDHADTPNLGGWTKNYGQGFTENVFNKTWGDFATLDESTEATFLAGTPIPDPTPETPATTGQPPAPPDLSGYDDIEKTLGNTYDYHKGNEYNVHVGNATEYVAGNLTEYFTGTTSITFKGTSIENFEGNSTWHFDGQHTETVTGGKLETHTGHKESLFLGNDFTLHGAGLEDLYGGFKLEVMLGIDTGINVAAHLKFTGGCGIDRAAARINSETFELKDARAAISVKDVEFKKIKSKVMAGLAVSIAQGAMFLVA